MGGFLSEVRNLAKFDSRRSSLNLYLIDFSIRDDLLFPGKCMLSSDLPLPCGQFLIWRTELYVVKGRYMSSREGFLA